FINDSRHKYEAKDFSTISYFEKLKSSNQRSGYLHTISTANRQSSLPPLILKPETGLLADNLDRNFVWGFGSFFIGMVLCLLLVACCLLLVACCSFSQQS